MRAWAVLWLAQGFGAGRVPLAPGTFGSLVGVVWFLLLAASGQLLVYAAGLVGGFFLSVSICGEAEGMLRRKDPGCIVLDEITALPVCFAAWVGSVAEQGRLPALDYFFQGRSLCLIAGGFVLFRIVDVLKPWPLRRLQELPGGWGITIDDYGAGCYVALLSLLIQGLHLTRVL